MADNQNKKNPKYLGGFWPIFIIVIVSMVAGGIIYAYAYGNMQQDEINSITFWHPFNPTSTPHKHSASTTPATTSSTPVKK